MPNLAENTIGQKSTTSNQGTNKMPKLDAKSHFFLENEAFTQTANQAFGIISDNEFRTTSLVSVNNKKVVSICSGQVFIQPTTGDITKINLILKPYRQPIKGLSIKYFIYRGLPKNQFLDTSDKVLSNGSGFITHIRNEFNNFYQQDANLAASQPEFLGKFIGYPDSTAPANEAQELTDLIDCYFYKISQTFDDETGEITNQKRAFEMPMISAGLDLATVSGEIGLDIVLNYGDYYIENDSNPFKLDLAFARKAFYVIDVSTIADSYQKKLMREAITEFIDPAAFYGLHANGGKINKIDTTTAITTPADIYTLITSFATKNNIYIYIQSNRQRSYNFYNKYVVSDTNSNNLKIGTTEANLVESTFETNNWPVKIFTTAPAAASTQQTIALQFTTDKSTNTSLFGVLANITSTNNENFVDAKDLVKAPDENGVIDNFTKTVIVSSPIANNFNIASIIQLIYLGKNIILSKHGMDDGDPATPPPDPILFTTKYMDDIFYLTDAISFLQAEKVFHVHSYKPTLYNQQAFEAKRGKVVSYTQRTENTIAISDTENLTLFTYISIVENEQSKHSNFSPNASPNKESTGYGVQNLNDVFTLQNLPNNEFVELVKFTDAGETVNGLYLKTQERAMPTSMVLGISKAENDLLKTLINNTKNAKIYFDPLFQDNNIFVSAENVKYGKYELSILTDSDDFKQVIVKSTTKITLYSLDKLLFFSLEYAKNIKAETNIGNQHSSFKIE